MVGLSTLLQNKVTFTKNLDEGGHEWLKCNLDPKKVRNNNQYARTNDRNQEKEQKYEQ